MDKTKVEVKIEPQVVKIPPTKEPEEDEVKKPETGELPPGTIIVDEVKQV